MIERNEMVPGLVSVVICAYNNWPDLEMTIASALHQSYQPIEVIVVDNSSTDATPQEIAGRFGHRVRYIRQPNRGSAGAYNAGFAVAHGEFLQFLSGDDVLAPNKIAKQVGVFRENPELDIVYGDVRKFQTLGGAANWSDFATQPEDDLLRAIFTDVGAFEDLGTLYHRKALEKVGPYDESLYIEDLDWRAAWAGCRFGHCPGVPMGFKRMHPHQKSQDAFRMAHGAEAIWGKALGYVTREPYRSLVAAQLAHLRFRMALFRDHLTTREALAKLALARRTSPETICALAYAAGYAAIALPGGTALARSRWLRPMRRLLARLLRLPMSRTSGNKSAPNGRHGARQ